MARQTTIQLIDDIDNISAASDTVRFSLDGSSYEIDLNEVHGAELRAAIAPYVDAGRRTSRPARPTATRRAQASATAGSPSADEIRTWAKANGHKVSERGRISAELRRAHEASH